MRDQCILWIAESRFFNAEADKGVMAAPRIGEGNMRTRGHDARHLSFLV